MYVHARVSYPPELELHTVVSCHVCCELNRSPLDHELFLTELLSRLSSPVFLFLFSDTLVM